MMQVLEYGKTYEAEPKILGEYERTWLNNLSNEISLTSQYRNNLLVNLTWILIGEDLLNWIFQNGNPSDTKIWFAATIDGSHWVQNNTHAYKYLKCLDLKCLL